MYMHVQAAMYMHVQAAIYLLPFLGYKVYTHTCFFHIVYLGGLL